MAFTTAIVADRKDRGRSPCGLWPRRHCLTGPWLHHKRLRRRRLREFWVACSIGDRRRHRRRMAYVGGRRRFRAIPQPPTAHSPAVVVGRRRRRSCFRGWKAYFIHRHPPPHLVRLPTITNFYLHRRELSQTFRAPAGDPVRPTRSSRRDWAADRRTDAYLRCCKIVVCMPSNFTVSCHRIIERSSIFMTVACRSLPEALMDDVVEPISS